MGNRSSLTSSGQECNSAKRLLIGIQLNSQEQTKEAIEFARKECIKPIGVFASTYTYDDMVKRLYEYLTNQYQVHMKDNEEIETLTPLEYAERIDSNVAACVIKQTIADLEKSIKMNETQGSNSVKETKQSLKERQRKFDYTSKGLEPPPHNKNKEEKISIKQIVKDNPDRALEAKMKLKAFQETRNKK